MATEGNAHAQIQIAVLPRARAGIGRGCRRAIEKAHGRWVARQGHAGSTDAAGVDVVGIASAGTREQLQRRRRAVSILEVRDGDAGAAANDRIVRAADDGAELVLALVVEA
jgi:hypothetical protein